MVLLAIVELSCKGLPRTNALAYFSLQSWTKQRCFIALTPARGLTNSLVVFVENLLNKVTGLEAKFVVAS
jgi:hypothetical protein